MTRSLPLFAALAVVLGATRALAAPSFRAQTFRLGAGKAATCSAEQRKSAVAELSALGLRDAGDAPLTSDVSVGLRCATGVRMVPVGTESVPERTFSVALTLAGNYGAEFEQTAASVKSAFSGAEQFLNDHSAGCSITADSKREFQLFVESEKDAARKLQFSLSTPHVVRGLKAGQPFSIHYEGDSSDGCGADGERRLGEKPEPKPPPSANPRVPVPPSPDEKPSPTPWLLLIVVPPAIILALFVKRSLTRLKLPIFISYRRNDSEGHAARLFEGLKRVFDASLLFMDSSSIPLGKNFETSLAQAISKSRVMLVVIGKQWLKELNARLETKDYVRIEVATALTQPNCEVVPILVGEAQLPFAAELPPDLAELPLRQAYALRSDERWDSDVRALIERLKALQLRP